MDDGDPDDKPQAPYLTAMHQFTGSFNNASQQLPTLMQHVSCARFPQHKQNQALGITSVANQLKTAEESLMRVCASLGPQGVIPGDPPTDSHNEVQQVMKIVYGRVKKAQTCLTNISTGAAIPHHNITEIMQAQQHVVHAETDLTQLFSITVDHEPYQPPHDQSMFTSLVEQASAKPIEIFLSVARSLAEKRLVIPQTHDRQQNSNSYEKLLESVLQYYELYNEIRARMVMDNANQSGNVSLLLQDLSDRLAKQENSQRRIIDPVFRGTTRIAEFIIALAPILRGMRDENALNAEAFAGMLSAAHSPHASTAVSAIEQAIAFQQSQRSGLRASARRLASVAFVGGLEQMGLVTGEQLGALERGVTQGRRRSEYIAHVRYMIDRYQLHFLIPTIIAILQQHGDSINPFMQEYADKIIAKEKDAARIHAIINGPSVLQKKDEDTWRYNEELARAAYREIHHKDASGNLTQKNNRWNEAEVSDLSELHTQISHRIYSHERVQKNREVNKQLIDYLARLAAIWKNPELYAYHSQPSGPYLGGYVPRLMSVPVPFSLLLSMGSPGSTGSSGSFAAVSSTVSSSSSSGFSSATLHEEDGESDFDTARSDVNDGDSEDDVSESDSMPALETDTEPDDDAFSPPEEFRSLNS